MATLDIDALEEGKENYDKLLAVFHIGTDVKRSLLQFYLNDKQLDLLECLTKISKTFLQFEDVKLARKRSLFIQPADLGLNTVDTVLKYNCFDIFWDCCLLNTSLEDILNHHKEELYRIYLHSNQQHDLPSMSTEYSSSCISKEHWEFLFKMEECRKMIEDDNVENIFASKGITVSRLDSNLNFVILKTVCPLFKSLLALSECQIGISKTAVFESGIQTSAFHDLWNQIEMHILRIGKHCQLKDYFRHKCVAVKSARFNKTLAQENRKCILDEAFNNPDLIDNARFCHRIQKELDLIAFDDKLHLIRTLCGREICVPLVGGHYEPGKYSQCVVENAEKDLQICKSVCDTEMNHIEIDEKMEMNGIQDRINIHNHLKIVQLITGTAKDVLVVVLKERLPLTDYGEAFNGMKTRIYPLLDNRERQLLFPDKSKYSGDLSDLDIGLLYIILRNINNICPHQNGWGQKPKDEDRTVSANIDRIRFMKNKYVSHSPNCSLNERKFLKTWKNVSQCVSELGGTEYEQKIARLFTTEINPVLENELITVRRTYEESDRQKERMIYGLEDQLNLITRQRSMEYNENPNNIDTPKAVETLTMKIRIAGDSTPSANEIKIGDFRNGDLCMKSVEEGSIIIGLEVLPSALENVGYFLGLIDDLVYSLLNKRTAAVNNTKHVIISMEFVDFNYEDQQSIRQQMSTVHKESPDNTEALKNHEDETSIIQQHSNVIKETTNYTEVPKDLEDQHSIRQQVSTVNEENPDKTEAPTDHVLLEQKREHCENDMNERVESSMLSAYNYISKKLKFFYNTLEDQSKNVPNDVRQRRYCKYITNFASHFGKEQCMVVGSTTEGTKLRSNINEGDFDYLIISGISIPVDALEHRDDLPSVVHIRGDKFQHSFSHNLVDGKYLPSRILKEVDRDAFKIMRGLFHVLTIPRVTKGRQTNHAEFNREAKPGMCTEHYAGFEVVGDDLSPSMKSRLTNLLSMLRETTQNDIFSSTIVQILVGLIASSVGDPECSLPKRRKQDTESTDDTPNEKVCRVKFNYKSSKDFIAAFPIDGKLKCLEEWKRRILNSDKAFWPSPEAVDKICQSEVYVVAKPAIVDPCTSIDFCLGFNQAEMILASCFSSDQRLCVLLLKALQKGYLKKYSSILTTFHWKTAFYHQCEQINPSLFNRYSTILNALENVLSYMIDCLERRYLKHYFIESNLIAHITETEANEIRGKIKEIIKDQEAALKVYFDMNKECESSKQEEEISLKEMEELKKCKFDTAIRIPKVITMMSDLQKEASDGSKLTKAIFDTLHMVIKEETDIPLKRSYTTRNPFDLRRQGASYHTTHISMRDEKKKALDEVRAAGFSALGSIFDFK